MDLDDDAALSSAAGSGLYTLCSSCAEYWDWAQHVLLLHEL
jgi:hypothetical protein